jgi:hypothetical protein
MKKRPSKGTDDTEDIACASAADLWNNLPQIAKLPCVEGFERIADYFRTAFLAYFDSLDGWGLPEPSKN